MTISPVAERGVKKKGRLWLSVVKHLFETDSIVCHNGPKFSAKGREMGMQLD